MKKNLKLSLLMLSVFAFTAPLASCKKNEDDRIAVTWWNNYVAPTSGTDEENRKNASYNEERLSELILLYLRRIILISE